MAPWRRADINAHRRSSWGFRGSRSRDSSPSCRQLESSQSSVRPFNSRARAPFCKAASKDRSMTMTSPVAFIWVVMRRSP